MRGPRNTDADILSTDALAQLSEAAHDLRYLLGRGYAQRSAITLVGDHLQLVKRQRQLLFRCVASPAVAAAVRHKTVASAAGRTLLVDGHNVLITLETALNGGPLVRADDGFLRDLSELHGAYRANASTPKAIALLAASLRALAPTAVALYLDRPIAFSARLADELREALGPEAGVELADSADGAIRARLRAGLDAVLASSDSALLAEASAVVDVVADAVRRGPVAEAWILELAT